MCKCYLGDPPSPAHWPRLCRVTGASGAKIGGICRGLAHCLWHKYVPTDTEEWHAATHIPAVCTRPCSPVPPVGACDASSSHPLESAIDVLSAPCSARLVLMRAPLDCHLPIATPGDVRWRTLLGPMPLGRLVLRVASFQQPIGQTSTQPPAHQTRRRRLPRRSSQLVPLTVRQRLA